MSGPVYFPESGSPWDKYWGMCVPDDSLPEKKIVIGKPELAKSAAAEEAAAESLDALGNIAQASINSDIRITGCGVETKNPLCEKDDSPLLTAVKFFDASGSQLSTESPNPLVGSKLTMKIQATTCEEGHADLSVKVKIGDADYKDAAYDEASGYYVFEFTVPDAKHFTYTIKVEDSNHDSAVVTKPEDIWTYTTPSDIPPFTIDKQYSEDGAIPNRPVTLSAGMDVEGYDLQWAVLDSKGNDVTPTNHSGAVITFVPPKDDLYTISLTISSDKLPQSIIKLDTLKIYEFPKPDVSLSGNQAPKSGETAYYTPLILGNLSEHDPVAAECDWQVYHLDPQGVPVYDIKSGELKQSCDKPLQMQFPQTIDQMSYVISINITGPGDIYKVGPISLPVIVYPKGTESVQADFTVSYSEYGAIPYKDIMLTAVATEIDPAKYDFVWEITDQAGVPIPNPPLPGLSTVVQFDKEGIYIAELSIQDKDTGDIIDTKGQIIKIYKFPPPEMDMDVNGNNAIYTGKQGVFTLAVARNWPEDTAAEITWEVKKVGAEETPISCQASANKKQYTCDFVSAGKYSVTATVNGVHDDNGTPVTVYTQKVAKFADVYLPAAGTVTADFAVSYSPDGAIAHRPVTFNGLILGVPQGNYDYIWTIKSKNGAAYNGPQPVSGESTSFTFNEPGIYQVALDVLTQGANPTVLASKEATVIIYPFPNPETDIDINGNLPMYIGQPAVLSGIINRNWAEDQAASMSWKITDKDGQNVACNPAGTTCGFTPAKAGTYQVELTVTSMDGATQIYQVKRLESGNAYLVSQGAGASVDFTAQFPPEGSIVNRPINFNSALVNGGDGAHTYTWTIESLNSQPYNGNQPAAGASTSYTFSQAGIYIISLKVYTPGVPEPIAAKTQSLIIYSFPKPQIDMDINGNLPIFEGNAANFTCVINRNWPEDQNAVCSWKVTHQEADPLNPGQTMTMDDCTETGKIVTCNFFTAKTYQVKLTVTGKDGNVTVYTTDLTESLNVYEPEGQ